MIFHNKKIISDILLLVKWGWHFQHSITEESCNGEKKKLSPDHKGKFIARLNS